MIQLDLHFDMFPKTNDAYIVGGSVRDLLIGRSPKDFDIVVKNNQEHFAEKIAQTHQGHVVKIGKDRQTIIRVILKDHTLDISNMNGDSIQDDLKQRDFTINALAYSLDTQKLVDCTGGLYDLENKTIRMVSEHIFQKDPIRLLRAYRISSDIDFQIEPKTCSLIKNDSALICNSAGERIRDELFKILASHNSHSYILKMVESGLLPALFPELIKLKGCSQNTHHIHDVYDHTLNAYKHLETLLNGNKRLIIKNFGSHFDSHHFSNHIDKSINHLLKYAMLLHDTGKPDSKTIDDNGRIHFFNHGKKSAELAGNVCDRLKFSTREEKTVDLIISNHLKPLFLFNLQQDNQLTHKAVTRFFMACGDLTPCVLLHFIADTYGKKEQVNDTIIKFAINLMTEYVSKFLKEKSKPALINGNDLISKLGLAPSPMFSKILNSIEEARLAGEIQNKKAALQLAKQIISVLSG
jgi:tRNA nucleotidyltransferase/poly(A) polymerase